MGSDGVAVAPKAGALPKEKPGVCGRGGGGIGASGVLRSAASVQTRRRASAGTAAGRRGGLTDAAGVEPKLNDMLLLLLHPEAR